MSSQRHGHGSKLFYSADERHQAKTRVNSPSKNFSDDLFATEV